MLRNSASAPGEVLADMFISMMDFQQEGDDKSGYRVSFNYRTSNLKNVYVVMEG